MDHRKAKWLLASLSLLLLSSRCLGQGTIQGGEKGIDYSGTNAQLVLPNTPLSTLAAGTGVNTFILAIPNPTVAIRVYITNNTANACASPIAIQMFSSSDAQVSSFNLSLSNWQTVLLQNPSGVLSPSVSVSLPASTAIFVTSTAIVSPKVTIQVVSTPSQCASTNIEVVAVVTQVSVSSPLVSTTGPNPLAGANEVQGIAPTGSSANLINPVLVSGQGPPINQGFQTSGLDTFTPLSEIKGLNGTNININMGKLPFPTQGVNETGLVIYSGINAACGIGSVSPQWTLTTAIPGGGNYGLASLFPAIGNTPFVRFSQGAGCTWNANTEISTFLNFTSTSINVNAATASPLTVTAGNNPAGSTILVAVACNSTTPCSITSITDTLGLSYAQITSFFDGAITGGNISGLNVWASTTTNPGGGDTVTVNTTGTIVGAIESYVLVGASPTNLVQPQIPGEMDSLGAQVVRLDATGVNQVTCSVTISTNTTTQLSNCPAAPTINGLPGRYYFTDLQINTTTAGTATTLTLKTGTGVNCASATLNLSQIAYPNTTVGLSNLVEFRTPIVAPVGTEICVTQAGTTAGTSVVELHAFVAP